MSADLPAPPDLAAAPRVLLSELENLVGERGSVDVCVGLLAGADPRDFAAELAYLGGRPAPGWLSGSRAPYWPRVWAARGLLYVWDDTAAPTVVAGVADGHWRVAEMCLKVAALHELGGAAGPALSLLEHELPRVRATAVRMLGVVGDTEHVAAVELRRDDPAAQVRRAAARAMERMRTRLDLPA